MATTQAGNGRTTVLLVNDEELIRAGLRAIIDAEPDLAVVGETGDGAEAVPLARRLRPDLVLLDLRLPAVGGVRASRLLTALDQPPKVLVVTADEADGGVYDALRAGANGFLFQRTRPEDIVRAIRLVVSGESVLSPAAIRSLAARHGGRSARGLAHLGLTEREAEVLRLMAGGLSNVEIAERLFVSVQTVKTHVGKLLAKLGARDRTQAVIIAYETGFVTPR